MASAAAAALTAVGVGDWAFTYNRANFRFDKKLQWKRFNTGRNFGIAQTALYREDVGDLCSIADQKLLVYMPCCLLFFAFNVTILVEGRSGLKFPAPPTYISCMYFTAHTMGLVAFGICFWLFTHGAMRANACSTQLLTRRVRLQIPLQSELDHARNFWSDFEKQRWQDILRLPFVTPHPGDSPDNSDAGSQSEKEDSESKGSKAGASGKRPAKDKQKIVSDKKMRMPGKSGATGWNKDEERRRKKYPRLSQSGVGVKYEDWQGGIPPDHFEIIRSSQRHWWAYEAYARTFMTVAVFHLLHGLAYWLPIHMYLELGLLWCGNVCAAGICGIIILIFKLDILPNDRLGRTYPIDCCGPVIACFALTLQFTASPSQTTHLIEQILQFVVVGVQIIWELRLLSLCSPEQTTLPMQTAMDSAGSPNPAGEMDRPGWLPGAFQHVQYLVAPPKVMPSGGGNPQTKSSWVKDDTGNQGRIGNPNFSGSTIDMTAWWIVQRMLLAFLVAWGIILAGRVVEAEMGERQLVRNPGLAPWSRNGWWSDFEQGPLTFKHYAHSTPQKGHFAWTGGPLEKEFHNWPFDVYGFHPESDGIDGTERRLQAASEPTVSWPALLEPRLVACSPHSARTLFALSPHGSAAVVDLAKGGLSSQAAAVALDGITGFGSLLGAAWGDSGLLAVTRMGRILGCAGPGPAGGGRWRCQASLEVPALPRATVDAAISASVLNHTGSGLRVAIVNSGSVELLTLREAAPARPAEWQSVATVKFASSSAVRPVAVTLAAGELLLAMENGSTHQWALLHNGSPAGDEPTAQRLETTESDNGMWLDVCRRADGQLARLVHRDVAGTASRRADLVL